MADRLKIAIDYRVGSIELEKHLDALGMDCTVTTLQYGDFRWVGNGPDGPVLIAVERKVTTDLFSSIDIKRLAGSQLQGLIENHHHSILLIEGMWRCGRNGKVETLKGKRWRTYKYGAVGRGGHAFVDGHLNTLRWVVGLKIIQTHTIHETALVLHNMVKWWQKPWKGHESHQVIYTPPFSNLGLVKPNLATRAAFQLPGVGEKLARAIAKRFKSFRGIGDADVNEWAELDGIGAEKSVNYVKLIRGER